MLYLEYEGSWYAFAYATLAGDNLSFSTGVIDYSYDYYGTYYYYTDYSAMDLTIY